MKKLFLTLLVAATALSGTAFDAQAKRVGGARSVGKQSGMASRQAAPRPYQAPQQSSQQQALPPSQAPMQAPGAAPRGIAPQAAPQPVPAGRMSPGTPGYPAPARSAGPFGGFLGGALLGMGLGSLFSHSGAGYPGNGMGGPYQGGGGILGSLLLFGLIALVALFAVRLFRRRKY
jgi:hypothetical protein